MSLPIFRPGLAAVLAAAPAIAAQEDPSLLAQANALVQKGDLAEAGRLFGLALESLRAKGDARGQAAALTGLGNLAAARGDKAEAVACYTQARTLFHSVGDGYYEGVMLGNLGLLSEKLGDRAKAVAYYEEALPLVRGHGTAERSTLDHLGSCLNVQEEWARSAVCWERAAPLFREAGDRDTEGRCLGNLGVCLQHLDQPRKALASYEQGAAASQAAGNLRNAGTLTALAGSIHSALGENAKAREAYERALPLHRAAGNAQGEVRVLHALASLADALGEPAKAQALAEQALELSRRIKDTEEETSCLNLLGNLSIAVDETARAIAYYEQALARYREAHDTAGESATLNNLGSAYGSLEDLEKSDACYRKALDLRRAAGNGKGVASSLCGMGANLIGSERNPRAEACFQEALALYRAASDQEGEARALNYLGVLYEAWGERTKALIHFEAALPMERACGNRMAEGGTLNNIGLIHYRSGRLQQALDYTRQSLEIRRAIQDRHGEAEALAFMAAYLPRLGRAAESPALFKEMARIQAVIREAAFPALGEAQRLAYVQDYKGNQYGFISLTAKYLPHDPAALRACFDAWLGYKGSVLETQGRIRAAAVASSDPQVKALQTSLQEARQTRARLFQGRAESPDDPARREALEAAGARVELLEVQLGKVSRAFALDREAGLVDSARLARLLPTGSAYVDFARIQWMDYDTGFWSGERYLAFVLLPGGEGRISLVDLGEAGAIDASVRDLRGRIQAARPVEKNLEDLHRLLLKPLEGALAGCRRLLISPDGALHLLPFELLGARGGKALMDRMDVSYVSSGQDLARVQAPVTASRTVAILADPDFDASGAAAAPGPVRRSRDAGTLRFSALPGTRREAQAIAELFPAADVLCLLGADASEGRLQGIRSPRVLHLATHGYFLGQQDLPEPGSNRGVKVVGAAPRAGLRVESPMLRSGIALARANASIRKGQDDGLVCAEKLLGMDLAGTDLVVLSACDTGVGKVQEGEGVFGLERAFLLAGARTLVVSLWPVPDDETRQLMEAFYKGMAAGRTKVQALAEAKRRVAARKPHPYYWAAFVLHGNPD